MPHRVAGILMRGRLRIQQHRGNPIRFAVRYACYYEDRIHASLILPSGHILDGDRRAFLPGSLPLYLVGRPVILPSMNSPRDDATLYG